MSYSSAAVADFFIFNVVAFLDHQSYSWCCIHRHRLHWPMIVTSVVGFVCYFCLMFWACLQIGAKNVFCSGLLWAFAMVYIGSWAFDTPLNFSKSLFIIFTIIPLIGITVKYKNLLVKRTQFFELNLFTPKTIGIPQKQKDFRFCHELSTTIMIIIIFIFLILNFYFYDKFRRDFKW